MKLFTFIFSLMFSVAALASENICGLWTTLDDKTNEPKSVVYIYEHNGYIFGRVVKLFKDPEKQMVGVKGNPKIVGSDIIWNMKPQEKMYIDGKIIDPKSGKIYTCQIHKQDEKLIVRGKIGPFGRNQTWIQNTDISLLPEQKPVPVLLEKE